MRDLSGRVDIFYPQEFDCFGFKRTFQQARKSWRLCLGELRVG
jgi:hypothetical protein